MNVLARAALVAVLVVAAGVGLYFAVQAPAEGKLVDNSRKAIPAGMTDARFYNPDVVPAEAGPHPKVQVEEPEYDFGTVVLGRSDSHTFVVRNVGDAPLLLGEPITTCKCTAPKAGNGEAIPPGGTAEITLTYTPEKVANEFVQKAHVHTNAPNDPRLELTVRGRVEKLFQQVPNGKVDFGAVTGDEPKTESFLVLTRLKDEIVVTGAESSSEYLKVTTEPADLSQPSRPAEPVDETIPEEERPPAEPPLSEQGYTAGIKVNVELLPGMAVGRIKESVTVRFDEESPDVEQRLREGKATADYSKLVSEVTGSVRGPFTFVAVQRENQKFLPTALALNLGTFPAEEGVKGTLQMFVYDMEEPIKLTAIESSEEYVQLTVRRDESFAVESGRQKLFLDFTVPPGAPPAQHIRKGKVTVTAKTNHPTADKLQFFVEMASYRGDGP